MSDDETPSYPIGQRITVELYHCSKPGQIKDKVTFEHGRVTGMTDNEAHNRRCGGEFSLDDGSLYSGDLYRYKSDDTHTWGWLQPHEIIPLESGL